MSTFYRITDGTLHELDVELVEGMAENKREILRPFVIDAQPQPSATQVLVDAGVIVDDVQARQTWALRDLTADERRITVSPRQIRQALSAAGLRFSGMSPDGRLPEIVELQSHPWFIGVQFHPELKSKPFDPHPLFASFIKAARDQSRLV